MKAKMLMVMIIQILCSLNVMANEQNDVPISYSSLQTMTGDTANTVVLTSMIKPSIEVTFNGDDGFSIDIYTIPNNKDGAKINLITLTSKFAKTFCYNGSRKAVLTLLDKLVEQSGTAVKLYKSSLSGKNINIAIHVRNALGNVQKFEGEIEPCK